MMVVFMPKSPRKAQIMSPDMLNVPTNVPTNTTAMVPASAIRIVPCVWIRDVSTRETTGLSNTGDIPASEKRPISSGVRWKTSAS